MTKVFTFYSYKGGVGRTMALVNVAFALARDGYRVLLVDLDLEAPGMTHFFADEIVRKKIYDHKDALDLLLDAKEELANQASSGNRDAVRSDSIAEYVISLDLPNSEGGRQHDLQSAIPYLRGRLDIIPATLELLQDKDNVSNNEYLRRMHKLDLPTVFSSTGPGHKLGEFVHKRFVDARFNTPSEPLFTLRNKVEAAYDLVLIDSRTGLSEISGLCIGPICDGLVVFTGLNDQNIKGTQFFMRKAGLLGDGSKTYMVVASPVPPWHSSEAESKYNSIRKLLSVKELHAIPYHPLAALREMMFVRQDPTELISLAYEKLAPAIASLTPKIESVKRRPAMIELSSIRLLNTPLPPVALGECNFPSAAAMHALYSLGGRPRGAASNLSSLAFSAGVAAQRLKSSEPFERAAELAEHCRPDKQKLLDSQLTYMYRRVLGRLPENWPIIKRVRQVFEAYREGSANEGSAKLLGMRTNISEMLDAIVAVAGDQYMNHPAGSSGDEKDRVIVRQIVAAILSPQLYYFSSAFSTRANESRWVDIAMIAHDLAPLDDKVTQTVQKFMRGFTTAESGKKKSDPQFMHELHMFDWDEMGGSLCGQPIPMLISAFSLVGGYDAAMAVAALMDSARNSFGYAWRALVNWRHVGDLTKSEPISRLLNAEDKMVEELEAKVNTGVLSL